MKGEKFKYFLGGLGVISIIVVLILIVLSGTPSEQGQASETPTAKYGKEDENRPIAILSKTKIDWGEINLNDTKEETIELKNEGKSPLEVTRMSTNCGCTAVKAIFSNGTETKEYSMHKSSEKVTVEPDSAITLKMIYRPFAMPVEGPVIRQVFLETNDPNNPKLEITANTVVKK